MIEAGVFITPFWCGYLLGVLTPVVLLALAVAIHQQSKRRDDAARKH